MADQAKTQVVGCAELLTVTITSEIARAPFNCRVLYLLPWKWTAMCFCLALRLRAIETSLLVTSSRDDIQYTVTALVPAREFQATPTL